MPCVCFLFTLLPLLWFFVWGGGNDKRRGRGEKLRLQIDRVRNGRVSTVQCSRKVRRNTTAC